MVVTVVITGGMFALRQRVEDSTTELITKVVPAKNGTANLVTTYSQQENRVQAFLLTDDPAFLQAYAADQANAAQFHSSVARRLAEDPVVQDLLGQVSAAAQEWRQDSVEPLIARSRSPGPLNLSTPEKQAAVAHITVAPQQNLDSGQLETQPSSVAYAFSFVNTYWAAADLFAETKYSPDRQWNSTHET